MLETDGSWLAGGMLNECRLVHHSHSISQPATLKATVKVGVFCVLARPSPVRVRPELEKADDPMGLRMALHSRTRVCVLAAGLPTTSSGP